MLEVWVREPDEASWEVFFVVPIRTPISRVSWLGLTHETLDIAIKGGENGDEPYSCY